MDLLLGTWVLLMGLHYCYVHQGDVVKPAPPAITWESKYDFGGEFGRRP